MSQGRQMYLRRTAKFTNLQAPVRSNPWSPVPTQAGGQMQMNPLQVPTADFCERCHVFHEHGQHIQSPEQLGTVAGAGKARMTSTAPDAGSMIALGGDIKDPCLSCVMDFIVAWSQVENAAKVNLALQRAFGWSPGLSPDLIADVIDAVQCMEDRMRVNPNCPYPVPPDLAAAIGNLLILMDNEFTEDPKHDAGIIREDARALVKKLEEFYGM